MLHENFEDDQLMKPHYESSKHMWIYNIVFLGHVLAQEPSFGDAS